MVASQLAPGFLNIICATVSENNTCMLFCDFKHLYITHVFYSQYNGKREEKSQYFSHWGPVTHNSNCSRILLVFLLRKSVAGEVTRPTHVW